VVILLWLAEEVQQQCDSVACILASEILSVNYSHNDKKLNTDIVRYCTHIVLQMI
jgi:hypothetical protein